MRAEKLSQHATEQLQQVVGGCEKRRARQHGEVKEEEVKVEAGEEEERVVRRLARGKRWNKGRTDEVLGQYISIHMYYCIHYSIHYIYCIQVLGQVQAGVRQVQRLADPEATESR